MDSGFPKGLDSKFFCVCFNAFPRISSSSSNRAVLKNVVRKQNKFVFFFRFTNYGIKCITFL